MTRRKRKSFEVLIVLFNEVPITTARRRRPWPRLRDEGGSGGSGSGGGGGTEPSLHAMCNIS